MSSYERSGKVQIPEWWLRKMLPILERTTIQLQEIARLASIAAGRVSPWNGSTMSKFVDGSVRTIALTNAISAVFGVPPPFVTAYTEAAAAQMAAISNPVTAVIVEDRKRSKRKIVDDAIDREIAQANVDTVAPLGVLLRADGKTRGRKGRGSSRRATGRRP